MSERAREFLDRWESDNVKDIPHTRRLQQVAGLAIQCRQDAIRVGITAEQLRAAAKGDLIRDLWAASVAANENNLNKECGMARASLWRRIIARLH